LWLALALVGFFGNRLGDWVIILATSLAGAYAVVLGLTRMFPTAVEASAEYVASGSAYVPFTGPAFAVFVIVFLVGALAQERIRSMRGRFVTR
jgi:membrane protein required for beta-lactamase induction